MIKKQEIFLELFEPVKENLWRFCLSLSKNRADAKDLLQDTIEQAYMNFENIKHQEAFLSFLFTITSRISRGKWKKDSNFEFTDSVDFETLVSDNVPPDVKVDITKLYEALDMLPPEQKEGIILFDIMGFSQPEICTIQAIELETLKKRLYRGRKKLAELLGDETPPQPSPKGRDQEHTFVSSDDLGEVPSRN
jgi:RNA polymerase sigma-70 factor, ECF subfamily